MFCPFCGNKIANEQSVFCMNCGKKIHDDANQPDVQQPMANQSAPAQTQTQAPAPQFAQPQVSPAPVVVSPTIAVKPKHNLIWIPIVAVILAGALVACYFLFFKSDEQMIEDRIDSFVTACNEMDMEGMIECFDGTTRKEYETMMSMAEGLLGGITGFDLPLGDIAELAGMQSGESMDIDIDVKSINIDGDTAEVEVTMIESGEESESDTMIMCKEDGDWYIDIREMTGGSIFGDLF